MQKYVIVNKQDDVSEKLALLLRKELHSFMEYDVDHPDLVITVGGDGTMLHSVHHYQDQLDHVAFVGIHTGTLGFLTDYQKEEYLDLVADIRVGQYDIDKRHLLEVTTNKGRYFALNELRLENNIRSQVLDIYINDTFFETFRGNGLCVSTASGSTAYNKSLGGAVLGFEVSMMQLSEIAGIHHNAYRSLGSPLILDKAHRLRFESQDFKNAILGIDHLVFDLQDVTYVDVCIASQYVRFAQLKQVSIMERLRRAFLDV